MTFPRVTVSSAFMTGMISVRAANRLAWRRELGAIAALSGPLALSNIAQVAMGTTDVMMMGWLGPDTLAAGALGTSLYFIALVFGIGLLNATAPMIARDLGRDPRAAEGVRHTVRLACLAAVCLALPAWCVLWWSEPLLTAIGQDPALSAAAGTYIHTLQWALLPSWAYLVLRSFVSALERPAWALLVSIAAVAFNAAANWCLMLGHCGFQPLGIAGSGLATSLSSTLMAVALGMAVGIVPPFRRYRLFTAVWRADWPRWRELWRLGLPMAATLTFEVTMFIAAVFLMGLIGAASLAAHAIVIQFCGLTFMVPLGIGQAVTVRVGRAHGARDHEGIRRAGWTGFWLAAAFMAATSLLMILAPRLLISLFLDPGDPGNAQAAGLAVSFLMLAAMFQIADGSQAVGSGMLRGLHDARMPMLFAFTGYWGIGLPLGILLAFPMGLGGVGIWIGLAAGLAVVALLMMRRWQRRARLGLLRARE